MPVFGDMTQFLQRARELKDTVANMCIGTCLQVCVMALVKLFAIEELRQPDAQKALYFASPRQSQCYPDILLACSIVRLAQTTE